ncbi:TPA: hypothetical protein ACR3OD_005721 [Bacillus anthracis]
MKERIERLKKLTYIPQKEIAWLIEQAELAVKQREIIEENKRQQEVTVHQFRQAQKEIQRLKQENTRYEYLLGESELSDKIQSICDHCKLTNGGREITIKDEEFGFLIEEANKSHRLQEENGRFRKALHQFANMKTVRTAPELVIQSYSRYAKEVLEGRGMEGDVK